ncbi:hypothetical protein RF11_07648 [Thelohanellus kitauei]|uniref:Uncharacterized protein n=1 Tax=Thelohanellus kitauei TaxID=669202 RepID=A0A0C2MJK5_THEKT|nr:hypothetical protein RF11_07648 [Thelohanellus kitauei]
MMEWRICVLIWILVIFRCTENPSELLRAQIADNKIKCDMAIDMRAELLKKDIDICTADPGEQDLFPCAVLSGFNPAKRHYHPIDVFFKEFMKIKEYLLIHEEILNCIGGETLFKKSVSCLTINIARTVLKQNDRIDHHFLNLICYIDKVKSTISSIIKATHDYHTRLVVVEYKKYDKEGLIVATKEANITRENVDEELEKYFAAVKDQKIENIVHLIGRAIMSHFGLNEGANRNVTCYSIIGLFKHTIGSPDSHNKYSEDPETLYPPNVWKNYKPIIDICTPTVENINTTITTIVYAGTYACILAIIIGVYISNRSQREDEETASDNRRPTRTQNTSTS